MKTTERHTIKPIGLARFLVSHGECEEGYETLRDRRVVTVICRGCEASFSFLTNSSSDQSSRDVEAALVELAEASGPDRHTDRSNSNNNSHPEPVHTPPNPTPTPQPRHGSARRLPPPGPLAPQRRRTRSLSDRLGPPLRDAGRRVLRAVDRRRRPTALAVLGLAGAYVLIALTVGGEPSSSQNNRALGGPEVPVTAPTPSAPPDEGPLAEGARPLQTFEAGGPEIQDLTVDAAQFRVALPPDWGSSLGTDGRTLLGPAAGGAEIQVIARPRGDLGISEMADEAAAFLASALPPGAQVERLAAQPVANLMAVARATTPSGVRTAYIGLGETTSYLVIDHTRNDAPALVRLQAEGVISSFEPG
jgi:hypothetical protein